MRNHLTSIFLSSTTFISSSLYSAFNRSLNRFIRVCKETEKVLFFLDATVLSFGRDRQGLWEDSVAKPAIKSAVGGYPASRFLSRTEDPVLYTKVALILLCLNVTPDESCKKVTLIVKVCEARSSGFCQRHLDSHVHSCRVSMCRGEGLTRHAKTTVRMCE